MNKTALLVLLLGTATFASAGIAVPEIDGNTAASAVAIVSGGLLILRGRKK